MNAQAFDNAVMEILSRPARGRKAGASSSPVVTRELTAEDIARLHLLPEGSLGMSARPLQRLRHSHHMLAQLLASGEKQEVCALATGYDPAYISNVQKDPTFKELVAHYSSQVHEVTIEVATRLRALGLDSIDELQSRIASSPDSLSNRELMDLAELAFDRSGHGPTSNVRLDARVALVSRDTISRIKEEVALQSTGAVKALEPPKDRGIEVGEVLDLVAVSESKRTEGGEGGRATISEESGEGT